MQRIRGVASERFEVEPSPLLVFGGTTQSQPFSPFGEEVETERTGRFDENMQREQRALVERAVYIERERRKYGSSQ